MGGGRSTRYAGRRESRAGALGRAVRSNAPTYNDASAGVLMSALELCSVDEGESVHKLVTRILRDSSGEVGEALVARYCKTLVSVDRQLILSVFDHHQQLMGKAAAMLRRGWGSRQAEQVVRTALKPLYRRRAQRAPVRDLEVDKATPCILLRRCACTRGCDLHDACYRADHLVRRLRVV